ncbi:nucleotidyl transferase AbiEii/AbiGii toxin family protein [Deferribacter autotrophicus]|uniref:Nucleotidyl transferase AbiEii/AbiGii toxin family protein n=1 Tax=Deferribacter autotrophicus TaxID=500465 RepID=A0A5A8F8F5_9BACT|nr:nucleotidyl transferase AbiEii/AbiGii toxin family protein [Deferribacter autotrophicus]KAA0258781.1 nucleotidyl transferase AbiEii/AbiGii toxin family protein [Deferribacter autotrophicus]
MKDYEKFYLENLYPFQDGILKIVKKLKTPFYLTGGTALSRCYFRHRYSDDLDFFVNSKNFFKKYGSLLIENFLNNEKEFNYKVDTERFQKSENYICLYLIKNEIQLKIDIVCDVKFRIDKPYYDKRFGLVDSWKNILVNKIGALYRFEPKDIADIWIISKNFTFDWRLIFKYATQKDIGIDTQTIYEIISTIPKEFLMSLKWSSDEYEKEIYDDLQIIASDIINGNINSLAKF